MKRLLLLCLAVGLGIQLNAQEIKLKKIKKIQVDQVVKNYEFGPKSHLIYLSTVKEEGKLRYNTRFNSTRSLDEAFSFESSSTSPDHGISAKAAKKQILVTLPDGTSRKLAPVGDVLYVWISVSPDGEQLLFTALSRGCFISDLEGNILKELGQLNAPSWVDKDWVIGMNDQDDGHMTTSSDLLAYHLGSELKQNLTSDSDAIAMYPSVSPGMDRIIFKNEKGELFTTKIKIQQ